jgi:putative sterol carrier protein
LVLFGTEQWIKVFIESVNNNKKFQRRAKNWEGDFIFVINSDDELEYDIYLWIDLYHGKAIDGRVLMSREEINAENLLEGSYGNWVKLIEGHLELIDGIMNKKFNYEGNIIRMMQNFRVGLELVNAARVIETEFY